MTFELDLQKEKNKYFTDYDNMRTKEILQGASARGYHRRQLSENVIQEIKNQTFDRIVAERLEKLSQKEKDQLLL